MACSTDQESVTLKILCILMPMWTSIFSFGILCIMSIMPLPVIPNSESSDIPIPNWKINGILLKLLIKFREAVDTFLLEEVFPLRFEYPKPSPHFKFCFKILISIGDIKPIPIDNPGLNADLSDEVIGEICPT